MHKRKEHAVTHPSLWRKIWGYWFFFVIAIWFFILYLWFLLTLTFPPLYPAAHSGRKFWGTMLFFFTGMRLKTTFESKLNRDKTYVIVSNHSSYLDIPCLTLGLPGYFIFLGKNELAKIPLFGRFFRTMDIAVDRKDVKRANVAFKQAIKRLKDGTSVMMFPEGTIGKWVPELGEFKDGPFMAAIMSGAEILPVTLPDNWHHLPDQGIVSASPGRLRMFVHRPISTEGLNLRDAASLKQSVFSIIDGKLKEMSAKD